MTDITLVVNRNHLLIPWLRYSHMGIRKPRQILLFPVAFFYSATEYYNIEGPNGNDKLMKNEVKNSVLLRGYFHEMKPVKDDSEG
jgi:hypothetical protein